MATLHELKIADPEVFFRLPTRWQLKHLAHVRNAIQGRHLPDPKKKRVPPGRASGRLAKHIEEWRKTRARAPSAAEIASARRILALSPATPAARAAMEPAQRAARQTLLRAGLEA